MHTPQTLVAQAKEQITEIDAEAVSARLDAATGAPIVIDVREIDEYYQGHLPKALHLPRGVLEFQIGDTVSDLQAPIIVYCKTGGRAALSAQALQTLGTPMCYQWRVVLKRGTRKGLRWCSQTNRIFINFTGDPLGLTRQRHGSALSPYLIIYHHQGVSYAYQ